MAFTRALVVACALALAPLGMATPASADPPSSGPVVDETPEVTVINAAKQRKQQVFSV